MLKLIFSALLIQVTIFVSAQVTIKMKRENGVSILPCKVNGLNLKFIFDTGASDVSISMTEATFMLKNDYLSPDDILGKSNYRDANGNITEGVNINLRELEIGGLKLYDVKASVVSNLKAPLLLGQTAISKLGKVQLDLNENTLTILPQGDSLDIRLNSRNDLQIDTPFVPLPVLKTKEEMYMEEAFDLFYQSQFQQAISKFDMVLLEDPKNVEALFHKALSFDMLEDYNSAIKEYNKVIELDSKHMLAYSYRGKSKYDLEDYTGALADLNKGININPKHIKGYIWRSETKEALNNISGAILDYDKAISIEPLDSSLYVDRAFLKIKAKDFKGALVDCNRAINIDDEYAWGYYCRGVTKNHLNDHAGAINDLDKSIELDPEFVNAYTIRGTIKEDKYEDFEGAMKDYNKALELDPDYLYARLRSSFLQEKIKKNVWIKACASNNGSNWYVYNSVVSKEYSVVKIWVKNEFKTYSYIKNGKNLTITNGYRLSLCQFNCNVKEYRIISSKLYNLKGELVYATDNYEYGSWDTPAPETVIETVLSKVCELYN